MGTRDRYFMTKARMDYILSMQADELRPSDRISRLYIDESSLVSLFLFLPFGSSSSIRKRV